MQRALESRAFIAAILAMAAGTFLFYAHPFPDEQIFLHVIALRAPHAFLSFKYLYYTFLFTTPYIVCSTAAFGALHLYAESPPAHLARTPCPSTPIPARETICFLSSAKSITRASRCPPRLPIGSRFPSADCSRESPSWALLGRGKTSCCMLPFAEQILAYKAADKEKRIGGLILEVKGDFCRKVKDILARHQRVEDYIEISLDSEYCYNPLHNDLDAYALAYNIASLLNNLFGRGKEPFWQQAYTNLVKFIILLHKAAYDYVTFFDVYQCAISPPLLEERIDEAEEIILGRHYVAITPKVFGERTADLAGLGFVHDEKEDRYLAPATPELRDILRMRGIPSEARTVHDPAQADPEKLAQLEAVQRWFHDDWKRIEPKLRTSIVEGVSVFLSLFDDNPKVKRVFCPKKECYDPQKNAGNQFGKPLPSFSWLIENGSRRRSEFPDWHERRTREGSGRDDEARFRARRAQSRSENRSPSRAIFPAGSLPLRRVPALRHRGRKRPDRRREILQSLATAEVHPDHRHAEHQLAAIRAARLKAGARFSRPSAPRFFSRCPTISPRGRRAISADAKTSSKSATACPKAGTTPRSVGSPAKLSRTRPTSSPRRATTRRATTAST